MVGFHFKNMVLWNDWYQKFSFLSGLINNTFKPDGQTITGLRLPSPEIMSLCVNMYPLQWMLLLLMRGNKYNVKYILHAEVLLPTE